MLGHSAENNAHHQPKYLRGAVNVLNSVTPKIRLYSLEEDGGESNLTKITPNVPPKSNERALPNSVQSFEKVGAGDEDRTRDPDLGKRIYRI
jgi:hypothetical protein